jgi:hypothetical protein
VGRWLCGLWALDYTASAAVGFEIILVGLRHYTVGVGLWLSLWPVCTQQKLAWLFDFTHIIWAFGIHDRSVGFGYEVEMNLLISSSLLG